MTTIPEKFLKAEERFGELEKLLADPQIINDKNQYQKFAKEYSDLIEFVSVFKIYREALKQFDDLKKLLHDKHDKDFEELARLELADLELQQKELFDKLMGLLNPQKNANRDIIIEIRAGTGGEEAALFAADLYRMYTRYAENKKWKVESIGSSPSDTGGFKEIIFSISGKGAEERLRWESGAHRVQRVPSTEASGRIHTSAATVAVMTEPQEVEIKIEPKDLKIDVYRSSGPGGQSVNTTDSAVRITHLASGLVIACQDERSQLKNRMKAMRVLRARLAEKYRTDTIEKTSQDRKLKIGTGDRSEKIRTYNFPDRRITDHRIGFTTHQLMSVLDGAMDELLDALAKAAVEESLK